MTQSPVAIWPWLLQTFGAWGAIVWVLLVVAFCAIWLVTPVMVWRLYRKHLALQQTLADLSERFAIQSRQQQADRLLRDKPRGKGGRRRRRGGTTNVRTLPQA